MEHKLYFAYGSNINLDQMAYRCPNAVVMGPVVLEDYELLFRGNSGGSGVATIAPKKGSVVYGLLWSITLACEQSLDRYEGVPWLYGKAPVTVRTREGTEFKVMAYIMTHERSRVPVLPSGAYYHGILEGFRQNGLPAGTLDQALRHCKQEVRALWQANCVRRNGCPPKRQRPPKRRDGNER